MIGIYKFVNKINNKVYVGQSKQLEIRYLQHKKYYDNKKYETYNTKFYRALRKYGFDNFDYEILEKGNFTKEQLNEKEIYWIKKLDSIENGYNILEGGNNSTVPRKLNKKQILEIKNKLKENFCNKEISEIYNISESLVSMLNNGRVWREIGNFSYPIRKRNYYCKGENNSHSKISNQDVLNIRKDYVYLTLKELYKKYDSLNISFSEFKKICYGVQFKNLPIYKKRKKQWYLNKTCIDYPLKEYNNY